jgi:hypothetical protein
LRIAVKRTSTRVVREKPSQAEAHGLKTNGADRRAARLDGKHARESKDP